MLDKLFADSTSETLAKGLDAVGIRHRVIADNIANVETPGFTRSDVVFEERLREALRSRGEDASERVQNVTPEVRADRTSPARADGNNVSIDKEMAAMVKNTLEYEALTQLINLKGSMLRAAITEGRR
ncbi:MAG: flagellar basal body rod protein FlgB [Armatimonadota bacterium]|nr:flagellar basal body rod protein FlgB [Armatimonadota bacterium]